MNKPYYILNIQHGRILDMRQVAYLSVLEKSGSRHYPTSCYADIVLISGERITFDCDPDTRGTIILEYNKFLEQESA